MPIWEYVIVRRDSDAKHWFSEPLGTSGALYDVLSSLGKRGWELCGVDGSQKWANGYMDHWSPPTLFFKGPAHEPN